MDGKPWNSNTKNVQPSIAIISHLWPVIEWCSNSVQLVMAFYYERGKETLKYVAVIWNQQYFWKYAKPAQTIEWLQYSYSNIANTYCVNPSCSGSPKISICPSYVVIQIRKCHQAELTVVHLLILDDTCTCEEMVIISQVGVVPRSHTSSCRYFLRINTLANR